MSIDLFLQHAVVQVKPVNVMGNPAPQTGVPTFTVTTPGIVTLGPSADGSSVDVIAVAGATGGTTVVVTGVSATGKNFSASFNVAVQSAAVANEAVSFDFVFGTPVSK